MMSAFGMFNALVMSYSRLPYAMAQDGMLPGFSPRVTQRTKAPWVSIVVLATGWALCLGLGFERLVTLDILIYGASLCWSSWRWWCCASPSPICPGRSRCRVASVGAILPVRLPMALLAFAVVRSDREQILGMNGFLFGALMIAAGFAVYAIDAMFARRAR